MLPTTRPGRRAVRLATVGLLTLIVTLGTAAPALAHVTVHTGEPAIQGGYAKIVFRVPNESDSASNTKVEVVFPKDAPFGGVSIEPPTGWSYEVSMRQLDEPIETEHGNLTEAVSSITWTAESSAAAIKPSEFAEFAISLGPLPTVERLVFPAIQTYSDGTVVKWNQTAAPGSPEPENPAPVLELVPEETADTAGPANNPEGSTAAATGSSPSGSAGGTALILAILALVVAVLAGATSATALLRGRST